MRRNDNLIFDFGMHIGEVTAFYLRKGFRVVAIEANPDLAQKGFARFPDEVKSGQLVIENVGVGPNDGLLTFYANIDNDEWSSFDKEIGTREGTRYKEMQVRCVNPIAIFENHGAPYFAKIDIEGFDVFVLRAIGLLAVKPRYVSVEDSGAHCVTEMYNAGVRWFKFMNQIDKWQIKLPNPPLEGSYVDTTFLAASSGPFGAEVPGEWLDVQGATAFYLKDVRPEAVPLNGWWDIHGMFG